MKTFACTNCDNRVYFENQRCAKCDFKLAFDPTVMAVVALAPIKSQSAGHFRRARSKSKQDLHYCANAKHGVCNWVLPAENPNELCQACDLNRTIPNLSEPRNLEAWGDLERAKKRLVYSLLRFGLPFVTPSSAPAALTFDFAHDAKTGHLNGVITVDVMEADAVWRERQRQHFDEPYRSLLGHFRHESGHFYWSALIEPNAQNLTAFRALFGDDRDDYKAALNRHHGRKTPIDWRSRHVSAYASAHPWEDWAESFAHYLHMVDSIDTAEAVGMEPRAAGFSLGQLWPFKSYDIYREASFEDLFERWIPLTLAMNSLSRSIGQQDYYPFIISDLARRKLAFVHDVVRGAVSRK